MYRTLLFFIFFTGHCNIAGMSTEYRENWNYKLVTVKLLVHYLLTKKLKIQYMLPIMHLANSVLKCPSLKSHWKLVALSQLDMFH